MVVHSEVFERFTQGDTLPVMAQAALENALSPRVLDLRFETVAERQYTRDFLFQEMPPEELAKILVAGARTVPLAEYAKSPRGPKKPKPQKQSGAKIKHVATSKRLKAQKECTK